MKMRFCPYCGTKFDEDAHFCKNCGEAIDNTAQEMKREKQKNLMPSKSTERTTIYDGEIHKCPNCGERLDAFVTTCPTCGYELRGAKAASAVKELALKLERTQTAEERIDIIRTFYIPNTKEDIYEFFILAVSNVNTDDDAAEAWQAKLEQAYQKAKLTFGNTPEFKNMSELYANVRKHHVFKSFIWNIKRSSALRIAILCIFAFILMVTGSFAGDFSGDGDSPFYFLAILGFLMLLVIGLYAIIKYDDKGKNKKEDHQNED